MHFVPSNQIPTYRKLNLPLIKIVFKKCKEDSYRPKYTTRFLLCLKRSDSQIFKNSSCKKPFLQSVCYWFNLLWWMFFILCDNWNTLFFIKTSPFSEVFWTATSLFLWTSVLKENHILYLISTITGRCWYQSSTIKLLYIIPLKSSWLILILQLFHIFLLCIQ